MAKGFCVNATLEKGRLHFIVPTKPEPLIVQLMTKGAVYPMPSRVAELPHNPIEETVQRPLLQCVCRYCHSRKLPRDLFVP